MAQAKENRKRWTVTGRGASLGSARKQFQKALQAETLRSRNDNCGRSVVYVYLRDKSSPSGKAGSPYYVGVAGDVNRPYQSHRRGGVKSRACDVPVPNDERRIRMLRGNLTNAQAKEWEKYYIKKYGRKDVGTGRKMLINRTDGGEGTIKRAVSKRLRTAVSEANKKREQTEESRQKKSAFMKEAHKDLLLAARWQASLVTAGRAKLLKALAKYNVSEGKWKSLTPKERQRVSQRYGQGVRGDRLFSGL